MQDDHHNNTLCYHLQKLTKTQELHEGHIFSPQYLGDVLERLRTMFQLDHTDTVILEDADYEITF